MRQKAEDNRDPKDRRRKLRKDYWSTTVTSGDVSVYAWENLDRGGFVFLKYASPRTTAKDGRAKKKLPSPRVPGARHGGIRRSSTTVL